MLLGTLARGTGLGGAFGLVLLIAGCTALQLCPSDAPSSETFLDRFDAKALRDKYAPQLEVREANGIRGSCFGTLGFRDKTVGFWGIRQSEQKLSEVLGMLQGDLREAVRASGAEIQGPIRVKLEKGLLKQFEFDYRCGRTTGKVSGEVGADEKDGSWNLQCLVEEYQARGE
jgi:hypothetical protein